MNNANQNRVLERCNAGIVEAFEKSSSDYQSKLQSTVAALAHAIEGGNAFLSEITAQYGQEKCPSAMAIAMATGVKDWMKILGECKPLLDKLEYQSRIQKTPTRGRF